VNKEDETVDFWFSGMSKYRNVTIYLKPAMTNYGPVPNKKKKKTDLPTLFFL